MRNKILVLATLAAAIGTPVAVQAQYQAQYDVTIERAPVVVESGPGIAIEQQPAFREYVVREHLPTFTTIEPVVVGTLLPETGVTYYEVPRRFGPVFYPYTIVNGETVLVEPRTRRIVEVLD